MRKEAGEEVIGQDADIALNVVVEHEPGSESRLVLTPSPNLPLAQGHSSSLRRS